MDLMPIDLCAREVLALTNADGRVFHIMHPDAPTFSQVLQALGRGDMGYPQEEFDRVFKESCWKMDLTLMPIVTETLRSMQGQTLGVSVTNEKTVAALAQAGFTFPTLSLETVLKEFKKGE